MTTPIEQMCIDARKRLAEFINRSAGQHIRALHEAAHKAAQKAGK